MSAPREPQPRRPDVRRVATDLVTASTTPPSLTRRPWSRPRFDPHTMNTPTVPTPAVPGPTRIAPATAPARRPPSRTWRGRSARVIGSNAVWGAAISAILILLAGAMTLATSQPWLFAALGPTAILVAYSPRQPMATFHSLVRGHLSASLIARL